MKFGIRYRQGDIVIVPFPFSDLSNIKQRPVLILSKTSDIEKNEDIVTCGITTHLKDSPYSLVIDIHNLESGSIPIKSKIKLDKLFTLNKNIIKRTVARLNKETFEKVRQEFFKLV